MKHITSACFALLLCACVSNNPQGTTERPESQARSDAAQPQSQSQPDGAPNKSATKSDQNSPTPAVQPAMAGTPIQAAATTAERDDVVVARVAGEEIYAGELLAFWLHNRSDEVREMLEHLVSAKLIRLEARQLGVELDPDELDLALLQTIQEIESEIRKQDPATSFREFVEVRLGLDSRRYEAQLRWEVERKLLGERVVRAFIMAQERVELKLIVLRSQSEIQDAQQRIEDGEDFSVVARELSVDPSAGFGGHIPPVLRNGTPLSELAFATPVGEVGGPLGMEGRWLLLEVEARREPLTGDWATVGGAVLADLEDEPLADAEYWQWKTEMRDRYKRDLEPFFELVSEPVL